MMATRTKQPRVVILAGAGAGASKAVEPQKFPTTVEFFQALPDEVVQDRFFQFVTSFLKKEEGVDVIDIELVLWELQKLIDFYDSVMKRNTIVGQSVATNLLKMVHNGYTFGHLEPGAPQLSKMLKQVTGLINQQVYDLYSYDPSDQELSENWIPLIDGLLSNGARLDIFTTNYDLVIENALQSLNADDFLYSYLGAPGRVQRYIDLKEWQEDAKRSGGLLTKLHGSLNWKQRGDRIAIGDVLFTGDHSRQAIIYPGFKGSSSAPFFAPFHDYLSRMLAQADHVLIAGFAFRDDAINQALRTSIPAGASVTVIDPNEAVKFPTRRKVQRIVGGFNRETVGTFLSTADSDSTHSSPASKRRLVRI